MTNMLLVVVLSTHLETNSVGKTVYETNKTGLFTVWFKPKIERITEIGYTNGTNVFKIGEVRRTEL